MSDNDQVPGTFWLSADGPQVLDETSRRYLRDLVPGGLGSALVGRLERSLELAQITSQYRRPLGPERKDFKSIADQAANLASALERLSTVSKVAFRTQAMRAPRGSLLGDLEDVGLYPRVDGLSVFKVALSDLAHLCEAAAAEMEVGRDVRPRMELSRGIVRRVVLDYFELTRMLPPRGRASWTVQFFAALQDCLKDEWTITLGADMVDATIADLDKEMRMQPD